jgi:ATP-dependent phosphofructokinase / diphosphate-dependent phosphofructokinase
MTSFKRVGIIFAGGPAPAANSVIAAAASGFRRRGTEVLGFMHGYSGLMSSEPMVAGEHYRSFLDRDLQGLRSARGIFLGTSRANPGKHLSSRADLDDVEKTKPLARVHENLVGLGVEALVSIGGDDTLKTANLFYEFQQRLPESTPRVRVVHVPKTIDNDYRGIDFTFGFFTAVGVMSEELLNLRADAMATQSYFVVETMGRKAGWLAYGVAIAGEAHLVLGVEDVEGDLALSETVVDAKGTPREEKKLDLDRLAERIVDLVLAREARGKKYGTIVLAEGLAEMLPEKYVKGIARDDHGHLSLGKVDLGKLVATLAGERFQARTGRAKKLTGVQLGYESRCAAPHAFDVLLGTQLGFGAYRALAEESLDGHMVSVGGQLNLSFVPFANLVDPTSLRTDVRFIPKGSDFGRLARELETRIPGLDR